MLSLLGRCVLLCISGISTRNPLGHSSSYFSKGIWIICATLVQILSQNFSIYVFKVFNCSLEKPSLQILFQMQKRVNYGTAACECDPAKHTGACEDETARCECLPKYIGMNCDHCAPGFYAPPECKPCDCSLNGTLDSTCLVLPFFQFVSALISCWKLKLIVSGWGHYTSIFGDLGVLLMICRRIVQVKRRFRFLDLQEI